ncbi:Xaa-Pro dipeptidyl-peptidase [Philodulcilactobacillus myokoensis]|uniref:Xaa-Pro dipeptidyl-peptidase n=1 Tax=Philodulcilactobacillus myokoensis TaxID=2929573 RepID=A0A9W6B0M1_9LACO|nr:Xaa-Pro dipeptidyl-peptidase [Philodulcilactobacillus myokoensis]GLB46571.1 Xaa-Pro dipeptidyl-peptidase [Philodulcilactobacillus myokoensis]
MKNHQFAIKPTSIKDEINELKMIHFLEPNDLNQQPRKLMLKLISRAFLEHQNAASNIKENIASLLATEDTNALEYLSKSNRPLNKIIFYNIALQLLRFKLTFDFKINQSQTFMKKSRLPIVNTSSDILSNQDVIKAWYLLLNTHTKFGQTYIDTIAAHGYYQQFNDLKKPLIFNGKTQPVFDTNQLIREVVYIEAPLDTDHDGKRDLLKADIVRPKESNQIKVPVLYTASPYNQGVNDQLSDQLTHQVNVKLKHKTPNHYQYQDIESHGNQSKNIPKPRKIKGESKYPTQSFSREMGYTLNNYFLSRGFAIVYAAGIGTKDSEGLRTTGDDLETISAKSIIEWLDNRRIAFTNKTDHIQVKAWWSNQHIAMTGRSYLGTLQTAVATTGVDGLKTCLSEAAISSWYDYYRDNGLVVAPGGFQGEDCDVLADETFSRFQKAGDYQHVKDQWKKQLDSITKHQDRLTGNYNQFWDARNYLKDVSHIKADIVMVHGLNDWNVKPRNVEHLWNALRNVPVQKKLFLHQGPHIYINNFQSLDFTDMMNLWLTNKLLDVDNDANQLIPDVTIQDNVKPQTWHTYQDWSNAKNALSLQIDNQFKLSDHQNGIKPMQFNDYLVPDIFNKYTKHYNKWYKDLMGNNDSPMSNNRLVFKTNPLKHDHYIDGKVHIKINAASSQNVGLLSFMLVDYGEATRLTHTPQLLSRNAIEAGYLWKRDDLKEFKLQKHPTPFKKITEGHINMQNRHNSYQVDELKPHQFYNVELDLQPTFYHLPAGRQLGLIVYASDMAMTIRGNQKIQYSIDPTKTIIHIPLWK